MCYGSRLPETSKRKMTADDPSKTRAPRSARQLRLFETTDPLTARFGVEFFRALPRSAGVYFFHDAEGRLLYIGQSSDLRARLGSYRHVSLDRHPRRTRRLVAAIVRIEWQLCPTAEAAVELESSLLLEHRPPFNRAGVWKGEPWWLSLNTVDGGLEVVLRRTPSQGDLGPLPPAFRHTLSLCLRAILRLAWPHWRLTDFPCGLMRSAVPLEFRVSSEQPHHLRDQLVQLLTSGPAELLAALDSQPFSHTEVERVFWQEERDRLTQLRPLMAHSTSTPSNVLAPAVVDSSLWLVGERFD